MLENGFVLLSAPLFDNAQFITQLHQDWQITDQEVQEKDGSLVFSVDSFLCAIALMPAPVPNDEAVYQARGNYFCEDAVQIASSHNAHLMVTVMSQEENVELQGMTLYTKLISTALYQGTATGVYTSGTVFSKEFYQTVVTQYLPKDEMPVMIWVFVRLGQTENGNQLYTVGMTKFGKDEMEILNSSLPMQTLHASLLSMCSYIISANLVLKDGETMGFSAEQKWQITRSQSVYADSDMSLKIGVV